MVGPLAQDLGAPTRANAVTVAANGAVVYSASRIELHRRWSEVSFRMQALRDNPQCASERTRSCWMPRIRGCMPGSRMTRRTMSRRRTSPGARGPQSPCCASRG